MSKTAAPSAAIAGLRRVLGDKSTNIPSLVDAKKPTIAAVKPAPVESKPVSLPSIVPKPVEQPKETFSFGFPDMDTRASAGLELGEADIEDVDKFDSENPLLVSDYVKDIYVYLRELEERFAPSATYMEGQTHITPAMRTILVDWIVEVHGRFKLVQETVFLTIHIMDRALERMVVPRSKLQLLGLGCFLIASKYEDTYPPRINDLIIVSNRAFTRAEILAMEASVLEKLNYDLGTPIPLHFLRRYSKVADSDAETHTLAKYLIELAQLDYEMLKFKYSQQGAAALYLARSIFGVEPWVSDCDSALLPRCFT
jgi:G2/mitotic-specific cyclin-B2